MDLLRVVRVADKIARLTGGEPDRPVCDGQSLADRAGEAGEGRPAARPGDQGDDNGHGSSSYPFDRRRGKRPGAPQNRSPPVVVVAGPTASGKSALALALADELGGTIINADSLQCYRDLRILTARPGPADEQRAPHRLYGFLDAAERGSAASWRAFALDQIAAALKAGRLPILVGGTGLYLRALARGLAPVPEIPEPVRRQALALHRALGGAGFRERLAQLDPAAAGRLSAGRYAAAGARL